MAIPPGNVNVNQSLYSLLNVRQNATSDEIKKNFRALARNYHPDKNSNLFADETMKQLNKAYSVLMDKAKREKYDEELVDGTEAGDLM